MGHSGQRFLTATGKGSDANDCVVHTNDAHE